MNQKTLTFTLSLILCCVAFIVRDSFLSFSIAKITGETVLFNESWKLPYQILPTIVFIFSIGIIPYLYLLIKRTCRINSVQKQVASAGIIITSGLLFYSLRLVYLKIKASQINDQLQRAEFISPDNIPTIRLEDMYLEFYFLMGLLVGTVVSFIIYRKNILTSQVNKGF